MKTTKWPTNESKRIILWVCFLLLWIQFADSLFFFLTGHLFLPFDTNTDSLGTLIILNLFKYIMLISISIVLVKLSSKIFDDFVASEADVKNDSQGIKGVEIIREMLVLAVLIVTIMGLGAAFLVVPVLCMLIGALINFKDSSDTITWLWSSVIDKNIQPLSYQSGFILLRFSILTMNFLISYFIVAPSFSKIFPKDAHKTI